PDPRQGGLDLCPGRGGGDQPQKFYRDAVERLQEALEHRARYGTRDGKGRTRRDINEAFGVESPEVTVAVSDQHLWDWFWEVDRFRAPSEHGVNPLTLRDVNDWSRLTGMPVSLDEARAILALDDHYRPALLAEFRAIAERQR